MKDNTYPACRGECNAGDRDCPHPQVCRMRIDWWAVLGAAIVALSAVIVVAAIAALWP